MDASTNAFGPAARHLVANPISTTTRLEIAATCILDDDGIFNRFRLIAHNCHSVPINTASDDRGLVCVPRARRLPRLTFYRERTFQSGRRRSTTTLIAEYWWPTWPTDSSVFAAQGHVCLSNKAGPESKVNPIGQWSTPCALRMTGTAPYWWSSIVRRAGSTGSP